MASTTRLRARRGSRLHEDDAGLERRPLDSAAGSTGPMTCGAATDGRSPCRTAALALSDGRSPPARVGIIEPNAGRPRSRPMSRWARGIGPCAYGSTRLDRRRLPGRRSLERSRRSERAAGLVSATPSSASSAGYSAAWFATGRAAHEQHQRLLGSSRSCLSWRHRDPPPYSTPLKVTIGADEALLACKARRRQGAPDKPRPHYPIGRTVWTRQAPVSEVAVGCVPRIGPRGELPPRGTGSRRPG